MSIQPNLRVQIFPNKNLVSKNVSKVQQTPYLRNIYIYIFFSKLKTILTNYKTKDNIEVICNVT